MPPHKQLSRAAGRLQSSTTEGSPPTAPGVQSPIIMHKRMIALSEWIHFRMPGLRLQLLRCHHQANKYALGYPFKHHASMQFSSTFSCSPNSSMQLL